MGIYDGEAKFSGCIFSNAVDFRNATFKNKVDFTLANFKNHAVFLDTVFELEVDFQEAKFKKSAVFYKTMFENEAKFKSCTFEIVTFNNVNFNGVAKFKESTFENDARFRGVTFKEWTSFKNIIVKNKLNFTYSRTYDFIDFSDSQIKNIDLEHTRFDSAGFLNLKGLNKENQTTVINKINFANKESVRLIKDHFEKQNNITEANKYFVIEQEKYIEELNNPKNKTEGNKWVKLIPLYFNKWISNFGTDWARALFSLFVFSYLATIGYIIITNIFGWLPDSNKDIIHSFSPPQTAFTVFMFLAWLNVYISTYKKDDRFNFIILCVLFAFFTLLAFYVNWDDTRITVNYIVQLINPINAFKEKNLYEGIEFYGMIVRVVTLIIIYQIIVAFRQFTRRG